jgi:hypothetical protein
VFSVHPRRRLLTRATSVNCSRRGLGVQGSGEPTVADQDSEKSFFNGQTPLRRNE